MFIIFDRLTWRLIQEIYQVLQFYAPQIWSVIFMSAIFSQPVSLPDSNKDWLIELIEWSRLFWFLHLEMVSLVAPAVMDCTYKPNLNSVTFHSWIHKPEPVERKTKKMLTSRRWPLTCLTLSFKTWPLLLTMIESKLPSRLRTVYRTI